MEKDDIYKVCQFSNTLLLYPFIIDYLILILLSLVQILKEGPEGSIVATAKKHDLKKGPSDIKFTALDKGRKAVAINDSVKVLEGPAEVWKI